METTVNHESDSANDRIKEFSVVGIAASPGKLEGLVQFLQHVDLIRGLSYIIAHHDGAQSKDFPLAQLSKHTKKQIFYAEDNMEIRPDCIYLLPPQQDFKFRSWKIFLNTYPSVEAENQLLPADRFMLSLAESFGSNTICILLSREGVDGAVGIDAITRANGLVMVEEKNTVSSIRSAGKELEVWNDYFLAPGDMPQHILEYIGFYTNQTKDSIAEELRTLFAILKQASGVDFSIYKQASIMRRLQRRMGIQELDNLKAYNYFLYHHSDEVLALQKDLLIGVTQFFRDPGAYTALYEKVLPAIFEQQGVEKQIRVWVAGCSTGEEVYSLAILFSKYMEEIEETFEVKIFATDVDQDSIRFAGKGIYPEFISKNVPPEYLQAYFTSQGNEYKINKEIRQMVIFAQHNLLHDPPFTQLDLVSCRNLLIYLQPEIQQKVIAQFNFSLKPEAYLFLGPSETLGKLTKLFKSLDNKWNLYQHKSSISTPGEYGQENTENGKRLIHKNKVISRLRENERIHKLDTISARLIEEYVGACIIIDQNNDIIHINGNANQLLIIPKGKPTHNLLKMVPEYLAVIIETVLHKVRKELKEVVYRDIAIKDSFKGHSIHIRAKSFDVDTINDKLMILFFEEAGMQQEEAPVHVKMEIQAPINLQSETEIEQYIHELDKELVNAKRSLQAANAKLQISNEELETSNEELGMTNEELIVSNEELQSTNEELQSGNEELLAVNHEYQFKIQELTDLNLDMSNFFNSTNVATVFVDAKLIVRKITPAMTKEIHLGELVIGQSIAEISPHLKYDQLVADANKVLLAGVTIEKEIQSSLDGKWFRLKILPFLTFDSVNQGVVITFIDITELKNARMPDLHTSEVLTTVSLLAARIAQEIRNPLTTLKGFTKMLVPGSAKIQHIEIMSTELEQIEAITDELLILARPQNLHFEKTDLILILQDVILRYELEAAAKGVDIITKFANQIPLVRCVPNQIKLVFSNILKNGIEAMTESGNLFIKVKVDANESVIVSFSDTGIGIREEEMAKLGDIFYTTKEEGLGLGLLICYKIVENHHGSISIKSTSNKGTLVEVSLR
ncbi:CheR family methyltransferase [Paenibacillus sepulcri]|uniref:histidine kinase n=1 Tax=Paenibacillus sepulcri TaxID=359917 RepID=A0ABS7BX89_9BACL|nr:PAS domain-containing protein [Paenibacillus sepulcri]